MFEAEVECPALAACNFHVNKNYEWISCSSCIALRQDERKRRPQAQEQQS